MTTDIPRILLVEDDEHIRRPLCRALRDAEFSVDFASSLQEGRERASEPFDLLLLDLGLPDGNGLTLCREIRADEPDRGIIVITARDDPEQRVHGLEAGADDYVIKPFHVPELIARMRGVLRRSGRKAGPERVVCGDLWADPHSRRAGRGERELELKRREFDLLYFLLTHRGRAWTRDQLVDRVWDSDYRGDTRTVDLHVRRVRAAIEDDPGTPRFLQTVWGVGYRLSEEVDH